MKIMKKLLILSLLISTFSFSQTAFELQKLEDFARLYGVVRYFHPSDEATQLDWNSFIIYGVKEISQTKNQEEFKEKLKEIFTPVAPSLSFENKKQQWDTLGLYPVYWIHNGLGIGSVGSMYKSNRFNKKIKSSTVGINISDTIFKGKNIKFQYSAKTIGGKAHGYFRIADNDKKLLFFKNYFQEPIISRNWKTKEFIIPAVSDYKKISIGFISKEGTLTFKDVKLFYEVKKNKWEKYPLPKFTSNKWYPIQKSELKRTKNEITVINSIPLTHPNIDWKSHYTLHLHNNLTVNIPTVVYTNGKETLPVANSLHFDQLNKNIKKINSTDFNQNVALANLIIVWNIFRHFYPYQQEVKVNWDDLLAKGLRNAYSDKTREDHLLTLRKFTEVFQDGHISISNPKMEDKSIYALPISWKWIGNELIVDKVMDGVTDIEKGDIIQKINGENVKDFIDSTAQYISGSSQWKQWRALQEGLKGKEDSKVTLLLRNGKKPELFRSILYSKNKDFYTREDTIKHKPITQDIYYINLDKLESAELDNLIPTINQYKKLIIDLRGYPKDRKHGILSYTPVVDSTQWLCSEKITLPFFSRFEETCYGHRLNDYKSDIRLKTKNVLLLDERSISNAEMLGQTLKHYNVASIVGHSTAGANGNINEIRLLNDFFVRFTGLKVKNPDGSQFHTIGVKPDIYVEETLEDIKQGKDPFIEKAIEILNINP
jgi:hypothetical protein